jgi:diacylglycerol kinase
VSPNDNKNSYLKKRTLSFKYAINGIINALKYQVNIRIHFSAAVIVTILGFYFRISTTEWIMIILSIGLVISAELFNSAIEELANYVSPQKNKAIGKIKDMAAGAVLVCAIAAAIIGILIFLPKLY